MGAVTDMDMDLEISNFRTAPVRLTLKLSLIAAGCLTAMNLSAQTAEGDSERVTNVGFSLGAGHSDNLRQSSTDPASGSYRGLGILLDIDRESRRFRADVEGDIEYRYFSAADIVDEPYGRLNAELELRAVPERFSWMATNSYAAGRTDPLRPLGPSNREQINVFETGPAVFLPLGERTEFRILGMAGERRFGDSKNLNSDTTLASGGVYRELSATTEIGVSVSTRDVEYDDQLASNTIDIAAFSYLKQFATGEANFNIGYNEVEFADGRTNDNPFIDMMWDRSVGRRSSLSLRFENRFIDAGDNISSDIVLQDAPELTLVSIDVFESTGVEAVFSITGNRSVLDFGARVVEEDYQSTNQFNNDALVLAVSYERQISPLMGFNASFVADDREFTGSQPDTFTDKIMTVGVERLFGRTLTVSGELGRNARSGSNFDFSENLITFHVRYDLNPAQRTSIFN